MEKAGNLYTRNETRRAHAMTRAELKQAAAENIALDYRATYAAALGIARAERDDPRAVWEATEPAEQWRALQRMTVWTRDHVDAAGCAPDGTPRAIVMDWVRSEADITDVAAEAYIMLRERMDRADADGRELPPLPCLLVDAVRNAARRINREQRRNGNAMRTRTTRSDDGGELTEDYIIMHAAPLAEPIQPSPEAYTLTRDAIERAAADDLDARIIRARACGYTQAETAAALRVTQKTISKRLAAIRERYERDA